MKKLITTVVTIIMLGIAPIMTATPAQARGGEGWWPQTKPVIDPKPTCPQIVKDGRFFRVVECNPNI